MKKLDDIPKKSVFKVPDGYFDQLPAVIQTRMAKEGRRPKLQVVLGFSLKYALPVIALVIAGIFWFRPEAPIEVQLSEIDASQIALYLDNAYTDDIVGNEESREWTEAELDDLEEQVYSSMEYTVDTDILDDIDL